MARIIMRGGFGTPLGQGDGQTHLVDDQKIRLRDPRSSLPRNLVTTTNINHIDDIIRQFPRVICFLHQPSSLTQTLVPDSPARLSPPLSTNSNSVSKTACSSSNACRFADISSRMAAWGHPPVSIARIRSAGSASFRIRNSWSSRVKMSFVTVAVGQPMSLLSDS